MVEEIVFAACRRSAERSAGLAGRRIARALPGVLVAVLVTALVAHGDAADARGDAGAPEPRRGETPRFAPTAVAPPP